MRENPPRLSCLGEVMESATSMLRFGMQRYGSNLCKAGPESATSTTTNDIFNPYTSEASNGATNPVLHLLSSLSTPDLNKQYKNQKQQ